MRKLHEPGAEAWPLSRAGADHRPVLERVVVESEHPAGHGVLNLSPDQALYVQSRLSVVAVAFLDGRGGHVEHLAVDRLPADHEDRLGRSGVRVWSIGHEGGVERSELAEVVIESDHWAGHGVVHLSPEQARYVHARLSQIAKAFLHENIWGGEAVAEQ
ncbi:MAG TPA: hypothetical protein VH482_17485 [Thermomicrobiales bacterium]|jgi:hypothetical protein